MNKILVTEKFNKLEIININLENQETDNLDDISKKYVLEGSPWFFLLNNEVNLDPYFFDAWTANWNTQALYIDIEKAKEVQRNRWRDSRQVLFKKYDTEYLIALESNDTKKIDKIKEIKQTLRDITKKSLPDDLILIKQTWPEEFALL
jgi:hypothetical protein